CSRSPRHLPTLPTRRSSDLDDRNGRPASMGRRGRSSFVLDEAPVIMLDGVRVPDFHALDTIEAQSILTIVIYNGVEGTTYYGTRSEEHTSELQSRVDLVCRL